MTRRDGAIVAVLLVVLAFLAGAVGAPSFAPAATPAPSPTPVPATGHVQGIVGRPSSITPLTARTQADRDLVALLFRGLVRLGPGTSLQPDLAASWQVEAKGTRWTFRLREDARWHDDVPVTSDDVLYTVRVLQDPDYTGALAATWAQVTATALDEHTVRFELSDPVGGFLQAATLPLLPAHLLEGTPVAALADSDFARDPIGDGAFALVELSGDGAVLEPVLAPVGLPEDPFASAAPGVATTTTPRLSRLELRFFDSADQLAAAFAAGQVDAAGDLPAAAAMDLAASVRGATTIRYPATTLTAITFNLRSPSGPFADARTRRALLAAVDRDGMVRALVGGAGSRADTPIPPSSWAFDAGSATPVAYDRAAAAAGLKAAGWRKLDGKWLPPKGKAALAVQLLAPDASANPLVNAAAGRVAKAWSSLGLETTVVALPPATFIERLRGGDFVAAVVDVNVGLDPDPYPILASTQVREGGANVSGLQDAGLDAALVAARAPGTMTSRLKAYRSLQQALATLAPMPTLFFRDSVMVVGPGLRGPVPRPVADPGDRFWDVLAWQTAGR